MWGTLKLGTRKALSAFEISRQCNVEVVSMLRFRLSSVNPIHCLFSLPTHRHSSVREVRIPSHSNHITSAASIVEGRESTIICPKVSSGLSLTSQEILSFESMAIVQLASVKSPSESHFNARQIGRTSDLSSTANKSLPLPNETLLCSEWSALTSSHLQLTSLRADAFYGSECRRV